MISRNWGRPVRRIGLSVAVGALVGLTGVVSAGDAMVPSAVQAKSGGEPIVHDIQPNERGIYIVGFKEAPLALYDGGDARFPAIERTDSGRLDVSSPVAEAYVEHLKTKQQEFLARFSSHVGRSVAPRNPQFQFQHAFNGMVLELSPKELEILRRDPEVVHLEGYTEYTLDTDVGPQWIGAPAVWNGTAPLNGFSSRGEGVVIGVIDSGANLGSPSFTATDADGYVHTNPLGNGNYLGWCNPTHPNHNPTRDVCNSKVIGGWDFSDNQITGTNREAAGFEDENGHGSHTASTAAGNKRQAQILGYDVTIQGVAPRANLVIYDACYTNSAGNGLCGNDATLASINQAVADGVVDVINYSISGGAQPWAEAASLAFLAAHNAGIYVSASAGNSGPGAATVAHNEPWVTTVAASTHSRRTYGFALSITGPTIEPATTDMLTRPGVAAPLINSLPLLNVPVVKSPTYDNAANNDGCAAFPAETFSRGGIRGIAVIHFRNGASVCGTSVRANNAVTAGADAVVFVPETIGTLNAAGGANRPVFVLLREDNKAALLAALDANPAALVGSFPSAVGQPFPGLGDVMANFSSRGPNTFDFLKPDVSAPGVQILAAVARWNLATAPGSLNPALNGAVGLLDGTSMSSPHNAGAAALVKAVNRSWKPSEIKSALMTTSTSAMLKEDEQRPADSFDFGAGRIDVSRAVRAGFLMDETGANFTAANPATGGSPANLNLASFQHQACVGTCTFPRSVRGTRSGVTWTSSIEGLPSGVATVTPVAITPTTTANTSFTLAVNSTLLPLNQWAFGYVVWTPSNPALPVKRMPIAFRPAAPRLQASRSSISAVLAASPTGDAIFASGFEAGEVPNPVAPSSASFPVTLSNAGNPILNWSFASGLQPATLINQGPALSNGFRSSEHNTSDANTGYATDDFDLLTPGQVNFLRSDGFALSGNLTVATSLNFRIYADSNGQPAGAPRPNGINVGAAPLWSASVPVNSPGVSIAAGGTANNISLDLNAAGLTAPLLPAGKYWVLVYPNLPGNGGNTQNNPLWAAAVVGTGVPVNGLPPLARSGLSTAAWGLPTVSGAPASGFSMRVNANVTCGAPWLSIDTASGSLGLAESQQVVVTVDGAGLAQGVYRALACFGSNSIEPTVVVPVTMTVASTDTNPTVQVAAAPATISTFGTSQLTFTLGNASIAALTSTAPFEVNLPAGLEIASPAAASTTCTSGSVTATAGGSLVSLAAGAQLPPASSCVVRVNVRSSTVGSYQIDVPAGALQTTPGGGSNQAGANVTLTVTAPVFPEPYCPINFTNSVDPISLVRFAGIDNASPSATGTPPALSNFLNIQGTVTRSSSAPITVKGNTDGNFPYQVIAYLDWNQNGVFDAAEATTVGIIQNSNGADAQEAVGSISVPATALTGSTRMRVVFQNPTVAGPCAGGGFGSAEDYTIVVN